MRIAVRILPSAVVVAAGNSAGVGAAGALQELLQLQQLVSSDGDELFGLDIVI